jgi:hypothetical protein
MPRARPVGYAAQGYLGQYLVVLPAQKVVAVRQRRAGLVFVERERDPKDSDLWPERLAALLMTSEP